MEKESKIIKPIDYETLWGEDDREVKKAVKCPYIGEMCELWDEKGSKCMAPLVTDDVCIKQI